MPADPARPASLAGHLVRVRRARSGRTQRIEVQQVIEGVLVGLAPYASTYERGGRYEGSYRGNAVAGVDEVVEVLGQVVEGRLAV